MRPNYQELWRAQALASYLNADNKIDVKPDHVIQWLNEIESVASLLKNALNEGEYPDSSSECILLAIPFMPFKAKRIDDIDMLLREFCAVVNDMNDEALQVLAEYGRRWEMIIDTTVPVGQPCSIKLSEQRPWTQNISSNAYKASKRNLYNRVRSQRRGKTTYVNQEIVFGDAKTSHIEIRTADHNTKVKKLHISDLSGTRNDTAVADEIRETEDTLAIYASDMRRPYFARVSFKVDIHLVHRLLFGCVTSVSILAVFALLMTHLLPDIFGAGDMNINDFRMLFVFPLTLTGALLLSREMTPLAERLLRCWKIVLLFVNTLMWIVIFIYLLV